MKRHTILLFIFCLAAIGLLGTNQAHAVTGADWRAGRIIDDAVFYNKHSMSVSDIQRFLESKVPVCDTWGAKPSEFGGGTRAQYGQSIGRPAPFICVRDYWQNTQTGEDNFGDGVIPAGAKSAAQIIWEEAQNYGINPQVILAKMHSEAANGLLLDDWPMAIQYRSAMGYACPDSTPGVCDSSYNGFYNQVHNAARQFRLYANNPNAYNHVGGRNNFVRWDPNPSCGGSTVFIENQATASLYNYTPYQPNQTALSNLYGGQDDGCSAFGNRNFWRTFNDWFGSTMGPDFSAKYHSQSAYPTLTQGDTTTITLQYKNDGRLPWYDGAVVGPTTPPVVLAASNPMNRASEFATPGWYSPSRPAVTFTAVYEADGTTLAANQHVAQPGQIARYDIPIKVPRDIYVGTYKEYFMPIREGAPGFSWYMGADTVHMAINVQRATKATYQYQSNYPTLGQNEKSSMFFVFKNTGSSVWYDDTTAAANNDYPVVLSTAEPMNRGSVFDTTGWTTNFRPVTRFSKVYEADGTTLAANQHVAQPGQIVRFEFNISSKITQNPGTFREYFTLIRQGARDWPIDGGGAYQDVTVTPGFYRASYVAQSNYPTINKGQSGTMSFRLKNTGNLKWYDDHTWIGGIHVVHFATSWPVNRGSIFGSNWPSSSRPNKVFSAVYEADNLTPAADQHVVLPGQIAEFSFPINIPANMPSGTYIEHFQPVLEYAPWFSWHMEGIVWQQVTVP